MKRLAPVIAALGAGCTVYMQPTEPAPQPPPPQADYSQAPPPSYQPAYEPAPESVVTINVEFQMGEPEPVYCPWAPPPMLVEPPPPPPFPDGFWTGGFWAWHGQWVWIHGHWSRPPRPGYFWHHPYYEHREGMVLFIPGYWDREGVAFIPPPPHRNYRRVMPNPGVPRGPMPIGPAGVFVPPPPGSRPGIIIPAPIGTAPAVVTGAPPVINPGMRIQNNINSGNTTVINNVTNVTNVTIIAPATATASGKPVNTNVPGQAHLAAGMTPVVHAAAPAPVSATPLPAFDPGRPATTLPPPQIVRPVMQHPVPPPVTHPVEPAQNPPPVKTQPTPEAHPNVITAPVQHPQPETPVHPVAPKTPPPPPPPVVKPVAKPPVKAAPVQNQPVPAVKKEIHPIQPQPNAKPANPPNQPPPVVKKKIVPPPEQPADNP